MKMSTRENIYREMESDWEIKSFTDFEDNVTTYQIRKAYPFLKRFEYKVPTEKDILNVINYLNFKTSNSFKISLVKDKDNIQNIFVPRTYKPKPKTIKQKVVAVYKYFKKIIGKQSLSDKITDRVLDFSYIEDLIENNKGYVDPRQQPGKMLIENLI